MKENKEMTRRDFLNVMAKGGAGVAAFSFLSAPGFDKLFAQAIAHIPVVWLQAGTCTGCSVTILNSVSPTIQDVLLDQVVPGKHISLAFHATVMASAGHMAIAELDVFKAGEKPFVLIVEGSISTKDKGVYCEVGVEPDSLKDITMMDHIKQLAPKAYATIGLGTCAAYGGIPMAGGEYGHKKGGPTGISPLGEFFKNEKIKTKKGEDAPYINVPGCPPHPDWIVGTIAAALLTFPKVGDAVKLLKIDKDGRPGVFFGDYIHDNCQFRGYYDRGDFASHYSEKKCLYTLGCKGPVTKADCSHRGWNNNENWCIGVGHGCIGCTEPWFAQSNDLFERAKVSSGHPVTYPAIDAKAEGYGTGAIAGAVAIGAAAGLALGGGIAVAKKSKSEEAS